MERDLKNLQDIGDIIRVHRVQAGLSQAELCLMAGVSRTALQGIELGKHRIQLDTLLKILHILNIRLQAVSPLSGPEREGR